LISILIILLFTITIVSLIFKNNFYTKTHEISDENITKDIVSKEKIEAPNNKENLKSASNEKIEAPDNKENLKSASNEIEKVKDETNLIKEKKTELSDQELEKILQEREKQVRENSKFINMTESNKEIPDYIGLVLAKIISDENIDSKNLILNSFEEVTWNTSSLGCPINGMFYAQVITNGYKLNLLKNNKTEEYHTDLMSNYVNCTEIKKSNINSTYNFVKEHDLVDIKKIELRLNDSDKSIASIEEKEDINRIIHSIDENITITQSDNCEPNYKLIFEKESSSIEMLVYCDENPNYVYVDESIIAGNTILNIVGEMLSTIEFPGMPK